MKTKAKEHIPSAGEAEKWLTPEIFVYKGKKYYVDAHAIVTLYVEAKPCGCSEKST